MPPRDDRVVGAEVVHPEEALPAELDGVRYEVEHRNPDRHLYQHRQAAGERTDTVLGILLHHRLLLLHLVLGLVELLGRLVEFRLQHAHLRRAHVALLHHRIGDELQQQGDENQHDTHREYLAQPVEDIEREPPVDDAEQRPAEVDEPLHIQVLAETALLLYRLEQAEVVGAEVELEL